MGHLTRLECALSSAGIMRLAVAQAAHHVSHRRAFQKTLIDQPMMTNVLADLHLEATAAAWLAFRVAAALDGEGDTSERALNRIGALSRSTGSASAWCRSSTRRSNATAATASSRTT
jgi:putative acyl-CoA dehydrogenase